MFRKTITAFLIGFAVVAPVRAQTFQTQAGIAYYAPLIGNFSTMGGDLLGMLVTGRFADGQSFAGNWANLGGGVSGVSFARFTLTMNTASNSWDTPFRLTVFGSSNTLSALELSGASGPVIFDRTFGGVGGTVNSNSGRDLLYVGGDSWNSLVTYANAVQMVGTSSPVGDVFETVRIEFRTGVQGSAGGRSVQFYQDVDNIVTGGLILPVPEPSTFLLTAAGLGAAMLLSVRRRRVAFAQTGGAAR
jgi:PEP-CTERM motif